MSASLQDQIRACTLCADRFAATATQHGPRPVPWFQSGAPIVVAGQAPGARVHASGRPFTDPSGDRLRAWMGIGEEDFYDLRKIAVWPSAFCFPGYNAKKSDLPPPPVCWKTWGAPVRAEIGQPKLTLLIGAHALRNHLGLRGPMREAVADWRRHAPDVFVLPHPSWRNTAWMKKAPWFEAEVIPALREAVSVALSGD